MITIVSTFVAEPLEPILGWLLREAGIDDSLCFAPYHQVFQELLTPTSALRTNASGVNVVLIRLEDFIRDLADKTAVAQTVHSVAAELAQAFEDFASQAKLPTALLVFPPSPAVPENLVNGMVGGSRGFCTARPGFSESPPHRQPRCHRRNPAWRVRPAARPSGAHTYTDEHYATVALAIARAIHAVKTTPAKVLVLDCDNTLWRGVVGEDGVEGIQVTQAHLELQDFAIEQQRKGVLVCLASKNTEGDVLNVLDMRPDMRLRGSHIVSHRINWLTKPANIRSLAEELNLGLDSFVFLDDNPVECAQMRAELPQVITLQVPEESGYSAFLRNLWVFDKLGITAEDASRTQMYRENVARRAVEQSTSDIGTFLAALEMKIDIATPSEEEWPRLEQLTQRTNQFNFTTRRRSASELRSLAQAGATVLRVRVADRFGDYGIVGLLVAETVGTTLRVDSLLLSCRVLGRGVEHSMLRRLGEDALLAGLMQVSLVHMPTVRNVPARAFAESVAADFARPVAQGTEYFLSAAFAAQIQHRPGHDPAEVMQALAAEEKKPVISGSDTTRGRSERYSRLAHNLQSGKAVLAQMSRTTAPRTAILGCRRGS